MCNEDKPLVGEQDKAARQRVCIELEHLLKFEAQKAQSEELPGLKRALALVADYRMGRVGCQRAGDEAR